MVGQFRVSNYPSKSFFFINDFEIGRKLEESWVELWVEYKTIVFPNYYIKIIFTDKFLYFRKFHVVIVAS